MSVFIDTEYHSSKEPQATPVCAVIYDELEDKLFAFWTHNDPKVQQLFRDKCNELKNRTWIAYNVVAEGTFFNACGLNPVKWDWIDQFIEYRQLTNNNDELGYGMQLVNGRPKMTKRLPPKFKRTEEDVKGGFSPKHSLAEATYKLCGEVRDTAHKNAMRDIIISGDDRLIEENKEAILAYCVEDTIHLPKMQKEIIKHFKKLITKKEMKTLESEMILRGKYMALTSNMERRGYPINVEETKNFSNSVNNIINSTCREINQLFPEIKPFKWNKKEFRYSVNTKALKYWIKANVPNYGQTWMRTDSGDISLKIDAWVRHFAFVHHYPKDNFGAQIVRFLKIKQNLYGFSTSSGKKSFWDFVGSDGRVRPYMNPYGAQSSRSQPGATGFLFLKSAWMRSLCQPVKGRAVGNYDYGSEEFLINALIGKDKAMIAAYKSGDVYLAFAKQAKAVPKEGTRAEYKAERDLFKATLLAVSYLMTAKGLAAKITSDTGQPCTEEEAQELIDLFNSVYSDFSDWQNDILEGYYNRQEYITLPCGWRMFLDNDNFRSVANCTPQGLGGCIMRKAVEFAEEAGLEVIMTLHDALYIEFDSDDMTAMDKLRDCMHRAFIHYFSDKKSASLIRLDGKVWSPDYTNDNFLIENINGENHIVTVNGEAISASEIFIDERAGDEHKQFSAYFKDTGVDLL